ncbi:UDP-N-acetyl-D-mannosamine dehydrogenase [Corynebacterium dentalis]|uniref:UDP-N-acetyl-D-mannosamine dehydrogenase n=1 Tax=Corynebacterium dentalis TaxID=2014528 RepID=UPI000C06D763|nr:UDP-N-acetyl-D-mannosamine dehydrogenase [Corynebacterium dentalis]
MRPYDFKSVSVIGMGYIGLPTAAFLASAGIDTIGVDIDSSKIDDINNGIVPFVEPDFDEFFSKVLRAGTLKAQTTVPDTDAYVIAVPTPLTDQHGVDLRYVKSAVEAIAPVVQPGNLIVLESTSPPGTTLKIREMLSDICRGFGRGPDLIDEILVAHCPERVLPGKIMKEMKENDRVVGGINPQSAEAARALYSRFCSGEIMLTDSKTAEMVKLVENSFRDVNIAFANELSLICESLNVNVWKLIEMANHHPRVKILTPGPGVGGHCIAVDPWFLVEAVPSQARLIRTAREVNDAKPGQVVAKISQLIENHGVLSIGLLGLAFKADIDDLRESPSVSIAQAAATLHPNVDFLISEPYIEQLPEELRQLPNVFLRDTDEVINSVEAAVLLVDHQEFKDSTRIKAFSKSWVDTRGIFEHWN